ncbi:TPA: PadR family transcriptional regulator [Vibrio cholerae]
MNLPVVLLSQLLNTKSGQSGYDLHKSIIEQLHYVWDCSHQQVYRELNKLETLGYVTFTVHPQDGKPDRKVYIITSEGRAYLDEQTQKPTPLPSMRNPLSALILALDSQGKSATELLTNHAGACSKRIERLGKQRSNVANDDLLTALLDRQINLLKVDLEWAKGLMESTNH